MTEQKESQNLPAVTPEKKPRPTHRSVRSRVRKGKRQGCSRPDRCKDRLSLISVAYKGPHSQYDDCRQSA